VSHTQFKGRAFLATGSLVAAAALMLAACASPPVSAPSNPQATSASTSSDLEEFYGQVLDWRNCGQADCTTFEVPLDYENPEGQRVTLSMTRVSANGESIGSLFVNPGGPGGSAFDYAKAADYIVTDQIRESFDVVGVDPRGVGLSEPIDCLTDEQTDELIASDASPDTELEESRLILDASVVGNACAGKNNPLIAHMSTVEVAKDMDIARALVGDPVMNMLGKSYGTSIASTYMQLFPQRVGRMVLDGVLPTYLDQLEVTRGQAEEFEILLRYFIEDCLNNDDCPVSGTTDQGVKQLQEFLMKLDEQPLVNAEGRELTQAVAEYAILSYLYFPEYDFDELRPALNDAMGNDDPDRLFTILDQRISRGADGKYEDNSNDSFYAVSCLDLPVTETFDQIRQFAQELQVSAPTFGPSLAWGATVCKDWPFQGIQPSAIQPGTSPPVMIVVTENDPATPARWGKDLAQKLGNAEVVEWVGGYNHTAYNEGSECVTNTVDAFLLDGAINPGSTTACD